jgi:hypothetical protein
MHRTAGPAGAPESPVLPMHAQLRAKPANAAMGRVPKAAQFLMATAEILMI